MGLNFLTTLEITPNPRRQKIGGGLLVLALAIAVFSILFFQNITPDYAPENPHAWLFHLLSIGVFGAGILTLNTAKISVARLPLLLFLIVGLAVAIRLYRFDEFPYGVWGDEAEAGITAQRMLHDSDFRPIYNGSLHMTWIQLWLYAGLLEIFGESSVLSLRVLSVLFGAAGVVMGYQVGEQIHSRRLGLWMAFFLASMRWSIVFSRLALTGIETPFFTLLTLFLLIRLLRHPNLLNAVLLGVAVGSGLLFYMAYRVIVLGLFLVALLHWRHKALPFFAIAGGTALLLLYPLLIFMQVYPDVFLRRQRDMYIGNLIPEKYASLPEAIFYNAQSYLKIFHLRGDRIELYNFDDRPMLDVVMGVLLLVGLGVAIRHIRRMENQFFLLTTLTALSAGVLSIAQAHAGRSIGVTAPVAYFCALAMVTWQERFLNTRRRADKTDRISASPVPTYFSAAKLSHVVSSFVVLAVIGLNFYAYFNRQAHDYNGWMVSGITEVIADEVRQRPAESYEVYLTNFIFTRNPTRFIAPDVYDRMQGVEVTSLFPITNTSGKSVLVLLERANLWAVDFARQLYPNIKISNPDLTPFSLTDAPTDNPYLYVLEISAEDLANAQSPNTGVLGEFYPNDSWAGEPELTRVDPTPYAYFHVIPFARPYTVVWSGCLAVPAAGEYEFFVATVGEAELRINGETLLRSDTDTGEQSAIINLSAGAVPIEIHYRDKQDYSALYVQWQGENLEKSALPPTLLTPDISACDS